LTSSGARHVRHAQQPVRAFTCDDRNAERRGRAGWESSSASPDAGWRRKRSEASRRKKEGEDGQASGGGGGAPASRGIKQRQRSTRPRGADVVWDADRVDGISIPSTPWVPTSRPIEPVWPRLDPRREAAFLVRPRCQMRPWRPAETEEAENGWIAWPDPTTTGGGATRPPSQPRSASGWRGAAGCSRVPNSNATLRAAGQLNHSVRDRIHG